MKARQTAFLLQALLLALSAVTPATRASTWRCPDGTPCVYTPGKGYRCHGSRATKPCCVKQQGEAWCHGCAHGDTSLRVPAQSFSRNIKGTCACVFTPNPAQVQATTPRDKLPLAGDRHELAQLPLAPSVIAPSHAIAGLTLVLPPYASDPPPQLFPRAPPAT